MITSKESLVGRSDSCACLAALAGEDASARNMDHNLRMTGLVRKRIDELKTKWLAKL